MRLSAVASFIALLWAPVAASSSTLPRIGNLEPTDVGGKMGDCGHYLNRANGDLILFDDFDDPVYMKIDGKVVRLIQQLPSRTENQPGGMAIYSDASGYIQVGDTSHMTKKLSNETVAVAGSLTVIVGGIAQTLVVTGTSGC